MAVYFLDLFAGAGGLSEGFIQAGYSPVAHVEQNSAACFTLKTRNVYFYLKNNNKLDIYYQYLRGEISRADLYSMVPVEEFDSVICESIDKNNRKKLFKKIDSLLGNNKLDLIIGGPPCQAYSLVGRSRHANNMIGDSRNYLYLEYIEFLKRYKPNVFVFENVTGLLSATDENGTKYIDNMIEAFKKAGYTINKYILNSESFGVPQKRKRVIIIGLRSKKNMEISFQDDVAEVTTVEDFIADLPRISAGGGSIYASSSKHKASTKLQTLDISDCPYITFHQARAHNERDLEIYRLVVQTWNKKGERLNYNDLPDRLKTHNNRTSFLDRFKVVISDQASHTVVAHISKDGHYYIHPDIEQNRSLTVREAARLQTFPDSYFFESDTGKPARTCAYVQIGNAVPVLLAKEIAKQLKTIVLEDQDGNSST